MTPSLRNRCRDGFDAGPVRDDTQVEMIQCREAHINLIYSELHEVRFPDLAARSNAYDPCLPNDSH